MAFFQKYSLIPPISASNSQQELYRPDEYVDFIPFGNAFAQSFQQRAPNANPLVPPEIKKSRIPQKKSGWWISDTDLEREKERIKALLSQAPILSESLEAPVSNSIKKAPFVAAIEKLKPLSPVVPLGSVVALAPAAEENSKTKSPESSRPSTRPSTRKSSRVATPANDPELVIVLEYLFKNGPSAAFEALLDKIESQEEHYRVFRHFYMRQLLSERKFLNASRLVSSAYKRIKSIDANPQLNAACKDLKYVIEKFHLIHLLEECKYEDAQKFLDDHLLKYKLKYEQGQSLRSKWYVYDFEQTSRLLNGASSYRKQFLNSWDFSAEIENLFNFSDKNTMEIDFKTAMKSLFSLEKPEIKRIATVESIKSCSSAEIPKRKKWLKNSSSTETSNIAKIQEPVTIQDSVIENCLVCSTEPYFIKNMAVCWIPESNRYIAAISSSDDRKDRYIRIYDLEAGQMLSQFDKKTSKSITNLKFHPTNFLLITTDMDGDLKVWDWTRSTIVSCFKKHHSRIVNKIDFVPGEPDRFVSCSSDNTLKIKHLLDSAIPIQSIHSNEPITSFSFAQEGDCGLNLIISLAYTIRIYSMRTMQLLKTLQLTELKASKMPISNICVHPSKPNWILLSVENTLQLLDLNEAPFQIIRQFNYREIPSGFRIEGKFSPCGNFVYANSWDKRNYSNASQDAPKGVYIWNILTGKIDRTAMPSLYSLHKQSAYKPVPVSWVDWMDNDSLVMARSDEKIIIVSK